MNRKPLIGGSCLVLAILLLFVHRAREAPAVSAGDGRSRPATRNHPPPGSSPPAIKARSPGEVARLRLLADIDAIVRSDRASDLGAYSILLNKLAEMDPAAAAAFACALDKGRWREEALQRVSQIWASKDAVSAEHWAATLADESERQAALTDVCVELAQSSAGPAVRLADIYGLGARSGSLMETLAQQWANQDFSAAAGWVKAQPAGEKREQMVMRLAFVQAQTQPADAARLVIAEIPDSPVQAEAVISVIYQWAKKDMAGARDWVGLFPECPLRDRAETELANMAAYPSQEQHNPNENNQDDNESHRSIE